MEANVPKIVTNEQDLRVVREVNTICAVFRETEALTGNCQSANGAKVNAA